MQYYGQKHYTQLSALDEKISTVQTELQKLPKEVITKTETINLGEELGKHNPCLRNVKSIFRRYLMTCSKSLRLH